MYSQELLQYVIDNDIATSTQEKYVASFMELNTISGVARRYGVDRTTVRKSIRSAVTKAARKGGFDGIDISPAHVLKGTSTLKNKRTGEELLQWVKTDLDTEAQLQAVKDAIEGLIESIPKVYIPEPDALTSKDMLNVYTITDAHIGMLVTMSGEEWNIDRATATLKGAFDHMMNSMPPAETCVIANIGDLFHFDGITPVTPTSRHVLDADVHYKDMIKAGLDVIMYAVSNALKRHNEVIILMAEGNHDIATSQLLQVVLPHVYGGNERVKFIDSDTPYYAYKHGKVMLCWHHGHLKKLDDLPLLMATQYADIWGATTKRYCHTGDKHHLTVKEHSGMIVTQHPTLAAKDAYTQRSGYFSQRATTAISYHSKYGEWLTMTVNPEMLGQSNGD